MRTALIIVGVIVAVNIITGLAGEAANKQARRTYA